MPSVISVVANRAIQSTRLAALDWVLHQTLVRRFGIAQACSYVPVSTNQCHFNLPKRIESISKSTRSLLQTNIPNKYTVVIVSNFVSSTCDTQNNMPVVFEQRVSMDHSLALDLMSVASWSETRHILIWYYTIQPDTQKGCKGVSTRDLHEHDARLQQRWCMKSEEVRNK